MVGKPVDPLPNDLDPGMLLDRARDLRSEFLSIHGQSRAGGNAILVRGAHDQRVERAHLLVKEPDGIVLGVVGAEAVRANHFGEAVGLVRRRHVAATAHLAQPHPQTGFAQLPCDFRTGEAAADDVDVETTGHCERSEAIQRSATGLPRACGARNDESS